MRRIHQAGARFARVKSVGRVRLLASRAGPKYPPGWCKARGGSLHARPVTRILPVSITEDEGRSGKGELPWTCHNPSPKSHVDPPGRPDSSASRANPVPGRMRDGSGRESAALAL